MTIYLVNIIARHGIPESISATYYKTEAKWLMPACVGGSAVLALVPLMNHTPENYKFIAFLIVASILFVASAPAFKDGLERKVHFGAASLLGVTTLTWLILTSGVPWIAVVGIITALIDRKHFIFWLEAGLLYNLYFVLLLDIPP